MHSLTSNTHFNLYKLDKVTTESDHAPPSDPAHLFHAVFDYKPALFRLGKQFMGRSQQQMVIKICPWWRSKILLALHKHPGARVSGDLTALCQLQNSAQRYCLDFNM